MTDFLQIFLRRLEGLIGLFVGDQSPNIVNQFVPLLSHLIELTCQGFEALSQNEPRRLDNGFVLTLSFGSVTFEEKERPADFEHCGIGKKVGRLVGNRERSPGLLQILESGFNMLRNLRTSDFKSLKPSFVQQVSDDFHEGQGLSFKRGDFITV